MATRPVVDGGTVNHELAMAMISGWPGATKFLLGAAAHPYEACHRGARHYEDDQHRARHHLARQSGERKRSAPVNLPLQHILLQWQLPWRVE